ncbi:pantoate--beta-alanine ligase [Ferrimonas sediminicola]|uniref:Pantothenate synthetase n=1 Tax=Ferrimonas sediminicola TaxID=2569538 RepID=A0A4U1BJC9_9GAMM|nr:pantoate--beta-alanine ligase [Ferrimonas sediminicola]TKB51483.1 pantoate--beta-alanine ligase [Ferrimonas sediminicola]
MQTISDIHRLHQQLKQWRSQGQSVAFVPTMGNLHEGHLLLVKEAKQRAERVVVSIFVNPMQFGAGEDLAAYPRTLEQDQAALVELGADLLFTPTPDLLYPQGLENQTYVEVPGISMRYCGESRPGHFRGVATVVCKLFNLVQPDLALFGMKDYQQLAVIRAMVRDLNMPVEVLGIDTVRASDGLALSSRNGYLTAEERQRAPELKRTLDWMAEQLHQGIAFGELERQAAQRLDNAGFSTDYIHICHAHNLDKAVSGDSELVILAAAQLGRARLIDNLRVDLAD